MSLGTAGNGFNETHIHSNSWKFYTLLYIRFHCWPGTNNCDIHVYHRKQGQVRLIARYMNQMGPAIYRPPCLGIYTTNHLNLLVLVVLVRYSVQSQHCFRWALLRAVYIALLCFQSEYANRTLVSERTSRPAATSREM